MSAGSRLVPKLLVQLVLMMGVLAGILFGAAGTWDWPSGWAFLGLFGALSLGFSLWLARTDPALLEERMKPAAGPQTLWDLAFIVFIVAAFAAWLGLMGLDARRMGWSHAPLAVQVVGAGLLAASFLGIGWVYRVNSFASPVVRLQTERHHVVVSSGPYAFVRHPMYVFAIGMFAAGSLMTGSWWSLATVPPIALAIALRALGEEQVLRAGLAGYEEYARRVRWRFAPGIW